MRSVNGNAIFAANYGITSFCVLTERMVLTMPKNAQYITICAADVGQRIDNFLRARLKGLPKSRLYKALRKGEVRVNKKRISADYRLQLDDSVRIPPLRLAPTASIPPVLSGHIATIRQAIIATHPDFLILNKPAGLAVHRGSGVAVGIIDILPQVFPDAPFLQLAHRLDRHTSGCLVVARNRDFLRHFQQQLRDGQVEKRYHAWVAGCWQHGECTIDAPLQRDDNHKQHVVRISHGEQAKSALTHITPVSCNQSISQLAIGLLTGRTHQIRVHLAHCQHPILGDDKYGDKQANATARARGLTRLALHASEVAFDLANGQRCCYVAPVPEDLQCLSVTCD